MEVHSSPHNVVVLTKYMPTVATSDRMSGANLTLRFSFAMP